MKKYNYDDMVMNQDLHEWAASERTRVFGDTRFEFEGKTVYVWQTYGGFETKDFAEDKTERSIEVLDFDLEGVDDEFNEDGYETDSTIYLTEDGLNDLNGAHMDAAAVAKHEPIEFTYDGEEFTFNYNLVITHTKTGTTYEG